MREPEGLSLQGEPSSVFEWERKTAAPLCVDGEARWSDGTAAGPVEQQWARELSKASLLSAAEEIQLAKRLRRGDAAARAQFIDANLKLVVSIAKRFRYTGVPMEDLIQEGNVGLIKAVDKFDPARGLRFSTVATVWIEGQIIRSSARLRNLVRLPVRTSATLAQLQRTREEVTQQMGREPTSADLAQALDATPERVEELESLCTPPAFFSEYAGDEAGRDPEELVGEDSAPTPAESALRSQTLTELRRHLAALPVRCQQLLQLRYGLDGHEEHTLASIGQQLGVSRQRVRQLEAGALTDLRRLLSESPAASPFAVAGAPAPVAEPVV